MIASNKRTASGPPIINFFSRRLSGDQLFHKQTTCSSLEQDVYFRFSSSQRGENKTDWDTPSAYFTFRTQLIFFFKRTVLDLLPSTIRMRRTVWREENGRVPLLFCSKPVSFPSLIQTHLIPKSFSRKRIQNMLENTYLLVKLMIK